MNCARAVEGEETRRARGQVKRDSARQNLQAKISGSESYQAPRQTVKTTYCTIIDMEPYAAPRRRTPLPPLKKAIVAAKKGAPQ